MRHKIEQRLEHDRKIMNDEIQRQTRYLQDFVDLMNDPSTRQRQQLMTARGSMYRHTRAERSKTVNGNKVADIVDVVRQRWSSDQESPPKVIVFSDNTSIFGALAKELDGLGVSHSELDGGSIRDMDSIISRYKCGDLSVIMVNSSMFDCGMNLENTTDIVFVHKVKNAAKYDQVIGRAQRYGRRNRRMVWQLYHQNEILADLGDTE
jgi:type I site-specific restriction endonuclease